MALISLNEAKEYLRVDSADEDAMITSLILSTEMLVKDVGRISDEKWKQINGGLETENNAEILQLRAIVRVAMLFSLGYLFEHRDEADHLALALTLRALLFSVREGIP